MIEKAKYTEDKYTPYGEDDPVERTTLEIVLKEPTAVQTKALKKLLTVFLQDVMGD